MKSTGFRTRKQERSYDYFKNQYGWKSRPCSVCSGGEKSCPRCEGSGAERYRGSKALPEGLIGIYIDTHPIYFNLVLDTWQGMSWLFCVYQDKHYSYRIEAPVSLSYNAQLDYLSRILQQRFPDMFKMRVGNYHQQRLAIRWFLSMIEVRNMREGLYGF